MFVDSLSLIGEMHIVAVVLTYLGIVITLGFGLNMYLGRQDRISVGVSDEILIPSFPIEGE